MLSIKFTSKVDVTEKALSVLQTCLFVLFLLVLVLEVEHFDEGSVTKSQKG